MNTLELLAHALLDAEERLAEHEKADAAEKKVRGFLKELREECRKEEVSDAMYMADVVLRLNDTLKRTQSIIDRIDVQVAAVNVRRAYAGLEQVTSDFFFPPECVESAQQTVAALAPMVNKIIHTITPSEYESNYRHHHDTLDLDWAALCKYENLMINHFGDLYKHVPRD